MKDKNKDNPFDASTELSMKLYKSKTKDVLNNWHDLTKFSEGLLDVLISQKQGSSKWIDHSMCTSDTHCCTNRAASNKWKKACPGYDNQNSCEKKKSKKGVGFCQWIPCDEVGECVWNGVSGSASLSKKCGKKTNEVDCKALNVNCNWEKIPSDQRFDYIEMDDDFEDDDTLEDEEFENENDEEFMIGKRKNHYYIEENENIFYKSQSQKIYNDEGNSGNGNGYYVFGVLLVLVCCYFVYSKCFMTKEKSNDFSSYTPLLTNDSV